MTAPIELLDPFRFTIASTILSTIDRDRWRCGRLPLMAESRTLELVTSPTVQRKQRGLVRAIPQRYLLGMTVQMTIRVDDELAAFVDEAAKSGDLSRAEVINRALRREIRRRAAERDAHIYATTHDPDLDSDAYASWAAANASSALTELD